MAEWFALYVGYWVQNPWIPFGHRVWVFFGHLYMSRPQAAELKATLNPGQPIPPSGELVPPDEVWEVQDSAGRVVPFPVHT